MRIKKKENKEKKFTKLENKKTKTYEDLGYKSSLCKESRFKLFCVQSVVKR